MRIAVLVISLHLLSFSCSKKEPKKIPHVLQINEVHVVPNIKAGYDVIIDDRLDTLQLESLAKTIFKQKDGEDYDNFFVNYYLPRMINGNISYASTHYTPDLKVSLYGMTREHINHIENVVKATRPFWLDESCQCLVKIKKHKGKLALLQITSPITNNDVVYDIFHLTPKVINGDTIYYKNISDVGEYYKYDTFRDIERHDNQGFIDKFLKLD